MTGLVDKELPRDYSQYGQSLILQQLVTPDTPKVVVDIGAHDGILGSNSRSLLENGWRGVLVEPVPSVFFALRNNCQHFVGISLVQAACSDCSGFAPMHIGKDGPHPQMSSLSSDPEIVGNVTAASIEVKTITLAHLLDGHKVPGDFGVLLIDTEGWDLNVLRGLSGTKARPRIIVTEEYPPTNAEKYRLLNEYNYRFLGTWGLDSFWIGVWHSADVTSLQMPVCRVSPSWFPSGRLIDSALATVDYEPLSPRCIVGWALTEVSRPPDSGVIVCLDRVDSLERYMFAACRVLRPDVSLHFNSDQLLMSGYRAPVEVPPGIYDVTIIQQGRGFYSKNYTGRIGFQVDISPIQ